MPKVSVKKHSITNLKTFGRAHRDEPFYGYLKIRLYPKYGTVDAEELAAWCGVRYLSSKSRKASYRIGTYRHANGKQYVDRVFFVDLTPADRAQLILKFGDFMDQKVERDGRLTRPRLTKAERVQRDALVQNFYNQIAAERRARLLALREDM